MKYDLGQFVYDKVLDVYGLIVFDEGDEMNRLFIGATKDKKSTEYIYLFKDIVEDNLVIPVIDRVSYPILINVVKDVMVYYKNIMKTDIERGHKLKNDTLKMMKDLTRVYEEEIYNKITQNYKKVNDFDVNKTYVLVYHTMLSGYDYKTFALFKYFGEKLIEIPANNYRISVVPRNVVIKDMFKFDIEKIKSYYNELPMYLGDVNTFKLFKLIDLDGYIRNNSEFKGCKEVIKLINLDLDVFEELFNYCKASDSQKANFIEIYEYENDLLLQPETVKLLEFEDKDKYVSVDTTAIEGDVPSLKVM